MKKKRENREKNDDLTAERERDGKSVTRSRPVQSIYSTVSGVSFAFRLSRIGRAGASPGRDRLISEIIARSLSFCNMCTVWSG